MWTIQRVMKRDQALAEERRASIQSAQHVEKVADGTRSTCEEKKKFSAARETWSLRWLHMLSRTYKKEQDSAVNK